MQPQSSHLKRLSLPPPAPMAVQKSPTLARVHRATLKIEEPHLFNFTIDDDDQEEEKVHSPLPGSMLPIFDELGAATGMTTLLKGPLVTPVQGLFFKKWKERYFLLTKDFLSCFKISSNGPSTMGPFISKIRLAEITKVEWSNSRSDALGTITLHLGPVLVSPIEDIAQPVYKKGSSELNAESPHNQRPPILLRSPQGVKESVLLDWFETMEEAVEASKMRRAARSASFGSNSSKRRPVSPMEKYTLNKMREFGAKLSLVQQTSKKVTFQDALPKRNV
ncbi:uncharacterized protein LOC132201939 [Neocloeon triangulifer]|uniref:uncharacterized protein LOC132201939 n=1 Tax=Neocloeon triangulifer TaxID=2078957 RepID=UPI00286F1C77|nr:uncharacterized protein LOC132201939 [Neocloeon triangulifer]